MHHASLFFYVPLGISFLFLMYLNYTTIYLDSNDNVVVNAVIGDKKYGYTVLFWNKYLVI